MYRPFEIEVQKSQRRYMYTVKWHQVVLRQTDFEYDSELAAIQAAEEFSHNHRLSN